MIPDWAPSFRRSQRAPTVHGVIPGVLPRTKLRQILIVGPMLHRLSQSNRRRPGPHQQWVGNQRPKVRQSLALNQPQLKRRPLSVLPPANLLPDAPPPLGMNRSKLQSSQRPAQPLGRKVRRPPPVGRNRQANRIGELHGMQVMHQTLLKASRPAPPLGTTLSTRPLKNNRLSAPGRIPVRPLAGSRKPPLRHRQYLILPVVRSRPHPRPHLGVVLFRPGRLNSPNHRLNY